jgi:predicted aspartyl protease
MNSWFDYQSGALSVRGDLTIAGYKTITVPFLLDTGATDVVITPMDSRRLGINQSMLSDPITMNGMGGGSDAHPLQAELAFVSGGHSYVYRLNVLIAIPTQGNGLVPSLLGRVILWRWNMAICHDNLSAQLDPSSWDDRI